MSHLVTDAALISGKDLHDAEACFAQLEGQGTCTVLFQAMESQLKAKPSCLCSVW